MTCHKYEAVLWLSNNPPKTNNIKKEKKKPTKKNAGARPTFGLPPLYFGTRRDRQLFWGSVNAALLAHGLHVSTTAEPHRTVMRGVEEGARGGGRGRCGGGVSEELQ